MNRLLSTLVIMTISFQAQASFIDRIMARLSEDIYTNFHGEGLPQKVGEKKEAVEYRKAFMDFNDIGESVDDIGLNQYDNNDFGMSLIKNGNDDQAFLNILRQRRYDQSYEWKNGPQFIRALKEYTRDYGCVGKITSLSHGWTSGGRPGEGSGLSGDKGMNGLYATEGDLPKALARAGARTLGGDLQKEIERGTIKFCNLCVAQFYACNISAKFAKTFSQVSGCQAVVATGQNSPEFQSFENPIEKRKVYEGSHYWKSAAGVWAERYSSEDRALGQRKASWYRSTPVKDENGKVQKIIEENLGETYISL